MSSRRDRREAGRFAFEGPELLRCALNAEVDVERVFVAPNVSVDVNDAVGDARRRGVEIATLADGVLESVADAKTPQGCISVAPRLECSVDDISRLSLVLVMDQLQDPGNLGAIVRVAEGCGADAVIVTENSVDPFGPKSLRAGAGSTFRLSVIEMGDALSVIESLEARNLQVFATSSHVGADFATVSWPDAVALVFGNEGAGLADTILERCHGVVRIPIASSLESLNVSVAAGILAMAAKRKLQTSKEAPAPSTMNIVSSQDVQ